MSHQPEAVRVPYLLRPLTIDTMDEQRPYYVRPGSISIAPDTGALTLQGDEKLKPASLRPPVMLGYVGIMLVTLFEGNDCTPVRGYVADLRRIANGNLFHTGTTADMPGDQEEANYWEETRKAERPIVACISRAAIKGAELIFDGDPRFEAATRELAALADKLDEELKKEQLKKAKKMRIPKSLKDTPSAGGSDDDPGDGQPLSPPSDNPDDSGKGGTKLKVRKHGRSVELETLEDD